MDLYGLRWPTTIRTEIERSILRSGGFINIKGQKYGHGFEYHMLEFQKSLWPEKDWHRWATLALREFCRNRLLGMMGPASSGKTHEAACWGLSNYMIWPEETTILVSSTDARSLELRIWGEIKKYWRMAKEVWDGCPGNLIESRQMIVTQNIDAWGRDFRNGIVGIPCVVGGTFVGLGKYVGIKNKRVILIADELQFMANAFMDAISNLNKNNGFQGIGIGNPKEQTDCLGKLCEPDRGLGGWEGIEQGKKTSVWKTRFASGSCIQFVGTDSPNFDYPENQPKRYPYLIGRREIADDLAYYGPDSLQFSMMNLGVMPQGLQTRRVLTKGLCETNKAFERADWWGTDTMLIAGLDAAYSAVGGDRTVLIILRIGKGAEGVWLMSLEQSPIIIPIKVSAKVEPEDQIASNVMDICTQLGIPPYSLYFDSTGRGTLTNAFARIWSPLVVPVEFSGEPSDRMVSDVIRIKACDHFSKFVSELWFQVRYIIEAGQFRQITESIVDEGCMREWKIVKGDKVEVEPKDIMKRRMGKSPDIFDALVAAVEGARRRGFMISPLANKTFGSRQQRDEWLRKFIDRRSHLRKSKSLTFSS